MRAGTHLFLCSLSGPFIPAPNGHFRGKKREFKKEEARGLRKKVLNSEVQNECYKVALKRL